MVVVLKILVLPIEMPWSIMAPIGKVWGISVPFRFVREDTVKGIVLEGDVGSQYDLGESILRNRVIFCDTLGVYLRAVEVPGAAEYFTDVG